MDDFHREREREEEAFWYLSWCPITISNSLYRCGFLHTSFPSLSFNRSATRCSPSSGRTRTMISSKTAYPRCLFRYSSPQASSSPSTSSTQLSVSSSPKKRLHTAVGSRESKERAQVRLMQPISVAEGAGGAGGGRVEFGNRVWRRVRSRVGNSCER